MGNVRALPIVCKGGECRVGYFCVHQRNAYVLDFSSYQFLYFIYGDIKFIYNKQEQQSFCMKLIMLGRDPEERVFLTQCFSSIYLELSVRSSTSQQRPLHGSDLCFSACQQVLLFNVIVTYLIYIGEFVKNAYQLCSR